MNTFIQKSLNKNDSKYIYNVFLKTKSIIVFNIDNSKKYLLGTKSAY